MTRQPLPRYLADNPSVATVIVVGVALVTVLLSVPTGHPAKAPSRSPYETCIAAANTPGPSGFATEVCEVLSDTYVQPVATLRESDWRPDGCVVFPARADSDALVYCPKDTP